MLWEFFSLGKEKKNIKWSTLMVIWIQTKRASQQISWSCNGFAVWMAKVSFSPFWILFKMLEQDVFVIRPCDSIQLLIKKWFYDNTTPASSHESTFKPRFQTLIVCNIFFAYLWLPLLLYSSPNRKVSRNLLPQMNAQVNIFTDNVKQSCCVHGRQTTN